tara:strand:+ start:6591 stop:7391 length:801 start_codon:yes stop_codon:yes gene_type:complete
MPEGPEVRKIAQTLAGAVSGETLNSVEVVSGRYLKKDPSGINLFRQQLPKKVVGAGCHGKFMYWMLDDECSIWSTLGMTGEWTLEKSKHTRLIFKLGNNEVYFNDQRNFGTLKFVRGKFALIEKLQSLGPDMLAEDVTDSNFISQIRKKPGWEITKALMDQAIVAGVGNYIKSDSLWLSKISPHRKVCDLNDVELKSLNNAIKRIMRESFNTGGSTIETYKDSTKEGEYTRRFLVYNQKMDPDGNKVVRELTADNRTTHWCPDIQI